MSVVKPIDHKAIFEQATGRPARIETISIGPKPIEPEINNGMTMSGKRKPISFAITPRRREQFFI